MTSVRNVEREVPEEEAAHLRVRQVAGRDLVDGCRQAHGGQSDQRPAGRCQSAAGLAGFLLSKKNRKIDIVRWR